MTKNYLSSKRYAITIEGIPVAFCESGFPASELSDWPTVLSTITEISEGEETLDTEQRKQLGSGFEWKSYDHNHVLKNLILPKQNSIAWVTEASVTDTETSIDVSDASVISSPFYMGRETITFAGTSGNTLVSCGRSAYGSEAHDFVYGSSEAGYAVEIYAAPPKWSGRQVTLWRSERDVKGNWSAKSSVKSMRMEDCPQFIGEDTWLFSGASLAEWYEGRPIFVGFSEIESADDPDEYNFTKTLTLTAAQKRQLWAGRNNQNACVTWHLGDHVLWTGPIENATGNNISLATTPVVSPKIFSPEGLDMNTVWERAKLTLGKEAYRWDMARPCLILNGSPIDITLTLLTSYLGFGAKGEWDTLPGIVAQEFGETEWHSGAGLDISAINVDSFDAQRGDAPSWFVTITEQTTAGEILKELCEATGCYWYVDGNGKISLDKLKERVPVSATVCEITDNVLAISSSDGIGITESMTHHTVSYESNWDPIVGEYQTIVNVVDAPAKSLLPFDNRVLQLSSKFIGVNQTQWGAKPAKFRRPSPISREELEVMLRRIQQYSKHGIAEIVVTVPDLSTTSLAAPGNHVAITNERMPNLEVGGQSIANKVGLCIGRQRNFDDGTINLRLQILNDGFIFCQSGYVESVTPAGSNYVLGLGVQDYTVTAGASLSTDWVIGWQVANTKRTWSGTITSSAAQYIGITPSGGAGIPTVGDVVIPLYDEGLTRNVSQGINPEDCVVGVNDNGTSTVKTRWS